MSENSSISFDTISPVHKNQLSRSASYCNGKPSIRKRGVSRDMQVASMGSQAQNILLGSIERKPENEFPVAAYDCQDADTVCDFLQVMKLEILSFHRLEFLAVFSLQGNGATSGILETQNLCPNLLPIYSVRESVSIMKAIWFPGLEGWYLETLCMDECRDLKKSRFVLRGV
jgi:hypothetical protein